MSMAKWKRVPPHRNPNYERAPVVGCFDDSLAHLPTFIGMAREHDAVLVVSPRPQTDEEWAKFLRNGPKPVYRKKPMA